jgi:hypothetical protein
MKRESLMLPWGFSVFYKFADFGDRISTYPRYNAFSVPLHTARIVSPPTTISRAPET